MPTLRILVTNTKVPKETGKLVAGVRRLRDALPGPVDHVIAAIQGVTDAALAAIAADAAPAPAPPADAAPQPHALLARLQELVRLNHSLLNALGVGHPALEAVVGDAGAQGFASKLTGAGGGGCALTLLPPRAGGEGDADGEVDARVAAAVAALRARGYDCFETRLGGDGLLLLRR